MLKLLCPNFFLFCPHFQQIKTFGCAIVTPAQSYVTISLSITQSSKDSIIRYLFPRLVQLYDILGV